SGGNISRAAAVLGVARNTLRSRIRKLGLTSGTGAPWGGTGKKRVTASRATEPEGASVARAGDAPPAPARGAGPPPGGEMIRWEQGRVRVLRAGVRDGRGAGEITPASSLLLSAAVEKIRSLGGRVEELGSAAIEASFGVEPLDDAVRCAALTPLALRLAVTR